MPNQEAETVSNLFFRNVVARFGCPLRVITDTRADGREKYGARYILVRPDHFVAWAGDAADDPAAVLSRVIAA